MYFVNATSDAHAPETKTVSNPSRFGQGLMRCATKGPAPNKTQHRKTMRMKHNHGSREHVPCSSDARWNNQIDNNYASTKPLTTVRSTQSLVTPNGHRGILLVATTAKGNIVDKNENVYDSVANRTRILRCNSRSTIAANWAQQRMDKLIWS
jgi:hypothetical protein